MKNVIGTALVLFGAAVGLYAGFWWAFLGGIMNVIEAVRAEDLVTLSVAIGVAKVMFAGVIGWLSAVVFVIPGMLCLQAK